jgi:probable phosphoglycerate mutase
LGNLQNLWEGKHTNSDLSTAGEKQAESTAYYLKRELGTLPAVYTSPQKRALDTAKLLARHLEASTKIVDAFHEIDMGDLEGKTTEEVLKVHPKILAQLESDPHHKLPGGESPAEAGIRMARALRDLSHSNLDAEIIIAVSHMVTIACGLAMLLDDRHTFLKYRPANCSVTVLNLQPEPELEIFNYTGHLP